MLIRSIFAAQVSWTRQRQCSFVPAINLTNIQTGKVHFALITDQLFTRATASWKMFNDNKCEAQTPTEILPVFHVAMF